MASESTVAPKPRLPVWGTLLAAIRIAMEQRSALLRAVLIPGLIMAGLWQVNGALFSNMLGSMRGGVSSGTAGYLVLSLFVVAPLMGLVGATFAVSCHRIVLIGENALPNRWGLFGGKREAKFFAWACLLLGVLPGASIVVAPVVFTPVVIGLSDFVSVDVLRVMPLMASAGAPIVVTALMTASFGLVLPKVALGEKASLKLAWNQAYGNIVRLATIVAIPMVTISVLSAIYSWSPVDVGLIADFAFQFAFVLLGVFQIVVLSHAYRVLTNPAPAKQAKTFLGSTFVILATTIAAFIATSWLVLTSEYYWAYRCRYLFQLEFFQLADSACINNAKAGNAESQLHVGVMYSEGWGFEQDYSEAVRWTRLSAEQGFPGAQTNLGYAYSEGLGVERNEEEAVRWYQLAAEQGDAVALSNLAHAYETGVGVDQNDTKAAELYRRSAELGFNSAQNYLGDMYFEGRGVPKDMNLAMNYWRLAAKQGNAEAADKLDKLRQ